MFLNNDLCPFFTKPAYLAESKTYTERAGWIPLQDIVPIAEIHVGGKNFHMMIDCIANDFSGGIETHRLRIEQRARERSRMMTFDPSRDVDQMGETRGVALRKPVTPKSLDLVKAAFGKLAVIAARRHAFDHLLF